MDLSPVPTPSDHPPLPEESSSTGGLKTLLMVSVLFLGVAGASFAFMRISQPNAGSKLSSSKTNSEIDSKTDSGEAEKPKAIVNAELQRETLLENVGSVSSIYLYQSYLNVGLLADSVENETYNKQEAGEILTTIATLVQTVDGQMAKLESVGLDKEDVDSIKQIRNISGLLKSQTQDLQKHWQNGDKAALDSFHQTRDQSWKELQRILGLNEKAQKGG